MNKSNTIYRDDSEYLNDMFTYLSLYLAEMGEERAQTKSKDSGKAQTKPRAKGAEKPEGKAATYYKKISNRLEMNQEIQALPRLERLVVSVPDEGARGFLRRFLTLLVKEKLNRQFRAEVEGKVNTLADYMDLLWQHESEDAFEVSRYTDYLYIKDFIELVFPELCDTDDFLNAPIDADIRLIDYLTGRDAYIPPQVRRIEPSEASELSFLDDVISREREELSSMHSRLLLWGESGGGKRSSLLAAAGGEAADGETSPAAAPVIFFYIQKDYRDRQMAKALCYAEREAFFYHSPLAVCGMEHIPDEAEFLGYFEDTPQELIPNIFFLSDTDTEPEASSFPRIHIGDYDDGERKRLWETFLAASDGGCETDADLDIDVLASTFIITPGKMKNAIAEARRTDGDVITKKGLYTACYDQLGHILNDKASRIVTTMDWDDLKLGDKNKSFLRDICNSIRARHEVHYKWNFKKKLPYGEGISIVFSGPPGTGKTMAAGVLANELGMEIYRIDLSQIMDKYVGETEKNIKNIFTSASKMSCILFFDEADAIFNKRMAAEGANERFANIESALLLQCIEEYNGISILATNDIGRIDSAFMRRFKYLIVFSNPDEAIRLEIWKSVFPEEAPLAGDVDLELLAKSFDISGALIKNIAVASAYLASCEGKDIGMKEILKATMRELEKNKMAISSEARYCFEMYLY